MWEEGKAIPAGGAVGSLVEGAPAVAGLDGAGMLGLVSVAAGASVLVLVVVGSVMGVFFFLVKRAFNLSRGDSGGTDYESVICTEHVCNGRRSENDELTTHVWRGSVGSTGVVALLDVWRAPEEMRSGMWMEMRFYFADGQSLGGENGGWKVRKAETRVHL